MPPSVARGTGQRHVARGTVVESAKVAKVESHVHYVVTFRKTHYLLEMELGCAFERCILYNV